jgi:hypothetical protein
MYEGEKDETTYDTAMISFNNHMSLPPFAQAFPMDSLTLPPMDDSTFAGRKRTRTSTSCDEDPSDSSEFVFLLLSALYLTFCHQVHPFA